ncbi:MAG: hypothetical protein DI609_01955 [Corynebacterium urealyticum]|uniref:Phage portal protein n=1 Tax=Corynebacterium urealyticum TaxID=43771 RepID=A0A2W5B7R3_9CORY|nr:MAG: hypothetical protein DI609_01955 [Corynebacterium urealyticum]
MSTLTPHETALTQRLLSQLAGFQSANRNHEQYYAGTFKPRYLGIGLPEIAKNLEMVAGWPATTVDVLEERLDILGWTNDDLGAVFADNALDVEASQVHLDALIYGTAFVSVTAGNGDDEPEVLVLGHDAKTTTGYYNPRTRRLDAAITKTVSPDGKTVEATLWGPHELVVSRRENDTSPWEVTNRIRHGFRRVPMIPFINRPRVGDRKGRSEISRAVRRYTDSAVRALTSMDVNREFFSAPQRYAVGVSEEDFTDASGNRKNPWQTVTGRIWAVPGAEEGQPQTQLGQFDPISAGPYLEQVKGLAQLLAAEASIPASYLGFTTENPSSADAIRQMEARLVKRAERRQTQFGHSWNQVGQLAQQALGIPNDNPNIKWAEASTPTLAATMDAMVKAVQVGILPTGPVIWDRLRFSPEEQRLLSQEVATRRAEGRAAMLAGLAQRGQEVPDLIGDDTFGGMPDGLSIDQA